VRKKIMEEVKEEIVSEEKVVEEVATSEAPVAEEAKIEEGFKKDGEVINSNEYNQALRKAREAEMRERELKRQLEETAAKKVEVPVAKVEPIKEAPKKDDIWADDDEDEEAVVVEAPVAQSPDVLSEAERMMEEKLKPFYEEQESKRLKAKEDQRTVFFEKHPQYLKDTKSWNLLLDTMETSINPNAGTYYDQLEMAALIVGGKQANPAVENKKAEIAVDSGSGGGVKSGSLEDSGLTAADRKIMKDMNISEEGMKAFKAKVASGSMTLIGGEQIIN
jgi:hypothetical protein